MLFKRHKVSRHSGLGTAHQRWPNEYVAAHRLFILATDHDALRQSAKR